MTMTAPIPLMCEPISDIALVFGVVSHCDDPWYECTEAAAPVRARCAPSCLLRPAEGDRVLLCRVLHGAEPPSILAIVARADARVGVLRLPGAAEMHGNADGLRLLAPSFTVDAARELRLQAADCRVQAPRGGIAVDDLTLQSRLLRAGIGSLNAVAHRVAADLGRMLLRARDCLRHVDGTDEVHAQSLRVCADQSYDLEAGQVNARSRGRMSLDGERIDLG